LTGTHGEQFLSLSYTAFLRRTALGLGPQAGGDLFGP